MTGMSELHRVIDRHFEHNGSKSLERSAVVRRVHDRAAVSFVVVAALLLGACIIPPSLSVEGDGGPGNSPPAILSVTVDQSQLIAPGPVTFNVGQMSTADVTLIDTDLEDTMTVRWFVDYNQNNQVNFRAEGHAAPSGLAQRTVTNIALSALCQQSDTTKPDHDLSIVVFDRTLTDELPNGGPGQPAFQDMASGGLSTSVQFHLTCFGTGQ
jgi:hypothetical protein